MKTCPTCRQHNSSLDRACSHCGADLRSTPNERVRVQSFVVPASLPYRISGVLLALWSGWAAAFAVVSVLFALQSGGGSLDGFLYLIASIGWLPVQVVTPATGVFVFLYFMLPRTAIAWRWTIAMPCGMVAGALSFACYRLDLAPATYAVAGLAGGVTCLCASLTRRTFYERTVRNDAPV